MANDGEKRGKGGRNGKYATNVLPKLKEVEEWAKNGLTDDMIARNLGISNDSLYEYKKRHAEFSDTLKRGKEVADFEVECALHKRAIGYDVKLLKQKVTKDGDIVDCYEDCHIPADTTAQIFWLKNRKPAEWRDKQNIELSGSLDIDTKAAEIKKQLFGMNK